ncbi:hypothetical protein F0L68_17075 [Solihabitans fulvus]|uniref:YbaB/EbfC DNA-binding family protein n=1 Tax=Solihabitans fulvus TaxID=1892852 RepID=A0A5B2XEK3_9PSEU|nr:hypothetical protein [Solihabitans fulvus]KAA2261489.1 hypothetical protein F0L68_17075 [Solihabitans fulvus]
MNDRRWGFEEADDEDYNARPATPSAEAAADSIEGRDPDGVITVAVTPTADVVSVNLAAEWKTLVDPHGLHACVLAATNAATMQALAVQVEQQSSTPDTGPTPSSRVEEVPLSRADVMRLVDAVSADLARFSDQVSPIVDRTVAAESPGRHASGTAKQGRILSLVVDAHWAAGARNSEIEYELLNVLRQLHTRSSPGELASGPHSPAISELTALVSDPTAFLRRLGLMPTPPVA